MVCKLYFNKAVIKKLNQEKVKYFKILIKNRKNRT